MGDEQVTNGTMEQRGFRFISYVGWLIVAGIAVPAVRSALDGEPLTSIASVAGMALVTAAILLGRRRSVQWGAVMLVASMICLAFVFGVTGKEGFRDISLLILPAGVVIGALLLVRPLYRIVTGLALAVLIVLWFLSISGSVDTSMAGRLDTHDLVDALIIMLVAAVAGDYLVVRMRSALHEAQVSTDRLREQVRRLQVLREMSTSISHMMEIPALCELIYERFPRELDVSRASVLLFDPARGVLLSDTMIKVRRGIDMPPGGPQGIDESISGKCFRERRPVIVNDCSRTDIIPRKYVEDLGLKSTLAVPIALKDEVLGVLRLDDTERTDRFTEGDVQFFTLVAGQLAVAIQNARLFEARKRTEEALRESEQRFRTLAEAPFEGIGVAERGTLIDANDQLAAMFGYARTDVIGMPVSAFVAPESRDLVAEAIRENRATAYEHTALRKDGSRFTAEVRARPMVVEGRMVRVTAIRDVTERKLAEEQLRAALHEKEVMLKEIHHRVKNNLQVVSSLLSLQASHVTDARTRDLLNDSQHRIRSMALVHEKLYRSVNLAQVDFAEYLRGVTGELERSYARPGVTCEVEAVSHFMGVDTAVPCGLIVNELVTNALKHAFPGGRTGAVRVMLRRGPGERVEIAVSDNGIGFPAGQDFRAMSSMGMTLVTNLCGQIGAEVNLTAGTGGTEFFIMFPA